MSEDDDAESLGRHLLVWAEYVADLRARAGESLAIIEASESVSVDRNLPASTVSQENSTIAAITYTQAQLNNNLNLVEGSGTVPPAEHDEGHHNPVSGTGAIPVVTEPDDLVIANGATPVVTQPGSGRSIEVRTAPIVTTSQVRGNTSSVEFHRVQPGPPNAPLDLAMRSLLHIRDTLNSDLQSMEDEVADANGSMTITAIDDVKEFCSGIQTMIKKDLKDAAEKVGNLDHAGTTGAAGIMADCLTRSTQRLRSIQASLRRAHMTAVLSSNGSSTTNSTDRNSSRESTPLSDSSRGYKPYREDQATNFLWKD